jgi:hypothetical protein
MSHQQRLDVGPSRTITVERRDPGLGRVGEEAPMMWVGSGSRVDEGGGAVDGAVGPKRQKIWLKGPRRPESMVPGSRSMRTACGTKRPLLASL